MSTENESPADVRDRVQADRQGVGVGHDVGRDVFTGTVYITYAAPAAEIPSKDESGDTASRNEADEERVPPELVEINRPFLERLAAHEDLLRSYVEGALIAVELDTKCGLVARWLDRTIGKLMAGEESPQLDLDEWEEIQTRVEGVADRVDQLCGKLRGVPALAESVAGLRDATLPFDAIDRASSDPASDHLAVLRDTADTNHATRKAATQLLSDCRQGATDLLDDVTKDVTWILAQAERAAERSARVIRAQQGSSVPPPRSTRAPDTTQDDRRAAPSTPNPASSPRTEVT